MAVASAPVNPRRQVSGQDWGGEADPSPSIRSVSYGPTDTSLQPVHVDIFWDAESIIHDGERRGLRWDWSCAIFETSDGSLHRGSVARIAQRLAPLEQGKAEVQPDGAKRLTSHVEALRHFVFDLKERRRDA
jgi:hypothetical protein